MNQADSVRVCLSGAYRGVVCGDEVGERDSLKVVAPELRSYNSDGAGYACGLTTLEVRQINSTLAKKRPRCDTQDVATEIRIAPVEHVVRATIAKAID